jgi:broad specificity phosphatase PhoE
MDPQLPAAQWHLSVEGFKRIPRLAVQISPYQPQVIFSSTESKAIGTGERLAEILELPFYFADGLHEHERTKIGYLGQDIFEDKVKNLFDHPDRIVFGEETANQALARFSNALVGVQTRQANKNLVVVSHGTVISLFVAHYNDLDPYQMWQSLGLPSFVVLKPPDYRLIATANSIES